MNFKNYSIKNFNDAKGYLDTFINYEKKTNYPYGKTLKLKRVEHLLKSLNIDYKKLKSIHIAGTKGKGSTATFCAYLLASAGYKVGLYTSPHFFDFRERIQVLTERQKKIKNSLISKEDVIKLIKEMQPQLENLRFTRKFGILSFFEVYTALAFKYFLNKNIDFAVLETGLGGRLDATNVVNPLVSIITHIGYDHTDKLGNTLSEIAYEKAGIIKNKTDVISSSQSPAVSDVLRQRSAKTNSRFFVLNDDFKTLNQSLTADSGNFDFCFGENKIKNLKISLKGKCQIENASLALASIFILKEKGLINGNVKFKEAIKKTFIGGRFEVVKKNPLIICDIAHNPLAFLALADNLKIYYPFKKIILIFAASSDKDVANMVKKINFKHIILTSFKNPRALGPFEIRKICKLDKAYIANNISEALNFARKIYNKDYLILISGSSFLVSEAKELLEKWIPGQKESNKK